MAGDVDELALAGEARARVPAGSFLQRALVGAGDDDHVQPEPGHPDPAERLADLQRPAVARGLELDQALLGAYVDRVVDEGHPRGVVGRERPVVALGQAVLLVGRVQRGDRVLPLPDEERPAEAERAGADQDSPGDADSLPHRLP